MAKKNTNKANKAETTPETTTTPEGWDKVETSTPETTPETQAELNKVEFPETVVESSLLPTPATEGQIDKIMAYLDKLRPSAKYRNPPRILALFKILLTNLLSIEWPELVKRMDIANSTTTRNGILKKLTPQESADFEVLFPAGQQGGGKSASLVREFWKSGQSMTVDNIQQMTGSEFQKIGYLVISAHRLGLSHNQNDIGEKFGISNVSALVSQMVKKLGDLGEGNPFENRETVRKYLITNRTDVGNWRELTDADIPDFN